MRNAGLMPLPDAGLKKALTDVVNSIAAENAAIEKVFLAENGLAARMQSEAGGEDQDFLYAQEKSIVRSINTIKLFSSYELEDASDLLQKINDSGDDDGGE